MHVFQGFVNEYPDVKIDQLVNVLLTRGDVSRGEARQVCDLCIHLVLFRSIDVIAGYFVNLYL